MLLCLLRMGSYEFLLLFADLCSLFLSSICNLVALMRIPGIVVKQKESALCEDFGSSLVANCSSL